jgi:hypothetical protein
MSFPLPARPVRIEDRLLPMTQMQVLGSPGQRGERHAEIVMLPWRAFIDDAVFALLVDDHQDERVLS